MNNISRRSLRCTMVSRMRNTCRILQQQKNHLTTTSLSISNNKIQQQQQKQQCYCNNLFIHNQSVSLHPLRQPVVSVINISQSLTQHHKQQQQFFFSTTTSTNILATEKQFEQQQQQQKDGNNINNDNITSTSSFKTNDTNNININTNTTTTHFGFEQIPINDKENMVRQVFDNVATSYDIMNDVMSFGIHRLWKDYFVHTTKLHSILKVKQNQMHIKLQNQMQQNQQQHFEQRQQQLPIQTKKETGTEPFRILDVAGGTGDIAFRFVDIAQQIQRQNQQQLSMNTDTPSNNNNNILLDVTVCDINNEMLKVGEQRARDRYSNNRSGIIFPSTLTSIPTLSTPTLNNNSKIAIQFQQGNAEQLYMYNDNTFDLYTIAFGLRNVTTIQNAITEAYRVLKPGGKICILEFSYGINNTILKQLYNMYSFTIIPTMGHYIANDKASYQYLIESIRQFPLQDDLVVLLQQHGKFQNVTYTNLSNGIVAIHEGYKPL